MRDIARDLGVSVATVSRALNDSPRISASQKERIQTYAKEHNFYPNVIGEALRHSRIQPMKLIGVIVPELKEHIVAGLEHGHHPVPMSESTEALGTPTVTGVIHDLDPIVEEARKDHAPTSFGAAFGHILWGAGAVTAEVYGRIVSRSVAGDRKSSAGSRKQ